MINSKRIKIILWSLGISGFILFLIIIYNLLTPNYANNNLSIILMLCFGLVLGAIIAFLALRKNTVSAPVVKESSHTVVESMRKVFKIVAAEGHFNEIYNYEENTKLWNFIPTKKKALVIVQAKVLVGYDFEKLKWEADDVTKKIKLIDFPSPEVLSTETDYKYYNIEENLFNLFSKEDLSKIQQNGKSQVIEAAKNSHLPEVAAEQMRTLLTELIQSKSWILENSHVIIDNSRKIEHQTNV